MLFWVLLASMSALLMLASPVGFSLRMVPTFFTGLFGPACRRSFKSTDLERSARTGLWSRVPDLGRVLVRPRSRLLLFVMAVRTAVSSASCLSPADVNALANESIALAKTTPGKGIDGRFVELVGVGAGVTPPFFKAWTLLVNA